MPFEVVGQYTDKDVCVDVICIWQEDGADSKINGLEAPKGLL